MAQYPIPQFIEEEGRIIFFLTYRQFFLLVGGGIICTVLYNVLPFWLFVFMAILVMLIISAIAFLKINNRGVVTVLLNYLGYSVRAKTYVWKKKTAKEAAVKTTKSPELKKLQEIPQMTPYTMRPSKLTQIKKMVDTKK